MYKLIRYCCLITAIIMLLGAGQNALADTFRHKTTGEVFDGFATQKQIRDRTLVFDSTNSDFKPVVLSEYDVEWNYKGRRDNVIVIRINSPEIFLSQTVCEEIANTIVEASNKGPRFILIEIDSPGGRGAYARIIAETIKDTTNCQIVSYIQGGTFGGVYSVAMMVPLASDRVFVSSTALGGSISPVVSSATQIANFTEHRETFSSKRTSLYKDYLVSLAVNSGRSETAAAAMVDPRIMVVRVQNQTGKQYLIDKKDRKGDEVIIAELSKKIPDAAGGPRTDEEILQTDEYMLTLTAGQMVEVKLADKIVDSENDVLAEMDSSGANLMIGSSVDRSIRKFQVNRQNASRIWASVDYLQHRTSELDSEIKATEEINRQTQRVRETRRDEITNSQQRMMEEDDNYLDENDYYIDENGIRRSVTGRTSRRETEVITEEQMQDTNPLYFDLEAVLSDLVANYDRLIAIGQRYPGALPEDITLTDLQNQMNSYQVWFFDIRDRNDIRERIQREAMQQTTRRPIGM